MTVQAPIGVAANLCDINAAVLVQEFRDQGNADCEATAESIATAGPGNQPGGGNGGANQVGLVNVAIGDVTVQVPIGVAANVCDINAALLVQEFEDAGNADCTATAETIATRGPGQGGGGA